MVPAFSAVRSLATMPLSGRSGSAPLPRVRHSSQFSDQRSAGGSQLWWRRFDLSFDPQQLAFPFNFKRPGLKALHPFEHERL